MDRDRKPAASIPPFGLRMQPELKGRIDEAARANNRSINAEIVARLEASFSAWPQVSLPNDLRERALRAEGAQRAGFEAALSGWAVDVFAGYFPTKERGKEGLTVGFDYYLDAIPDVDRARLRADFKATIDEFLEKNGI